MPITRRALLITSPGEVGDANYCGGVYVDIRNYRALLTSPHGGAWDGRETENGGEIKTLDKPTAKEVRLWVTDFSQYDYTLVMFTGHGWYSSMDKDRILELKKGEAIASLELLKGTKKRTIVLDCCQRVHQESLLQKRAQMESFSNAAQGRTPNREACRTLFLNQIAAAGPGFVRMLSCQTGEYSYVSDSTGSFYNSSLIDCADGWATQQARNPWGGNATFSVAEVHVPATAETRRRSGGLQNPDIENNKTGPSFPFAVFA
jgi:hypothetical protein